MTRWGRWWLAPAALFLVVVVAGFLVYRAAKPSVETQAREILEAQMRDPESIQLRNVRRVENGGLCGEVNARNAFGGYVGFQRFYIVGSFVTVEGESTLPGAVTEQCGP